MGTKGWEGWYGLGDKMHADSQRCEISRNCAYAHKQLVHPNSQSPTAAPVPWAHLCSSSFLLPVNARLVLLWAKYIQKLQKQLSINNNGINKTDKFQEINKLQVHRHATTIKTNASCQSVLPWGGTRPLGAHRERGTRSLDPWLTPPCHQAHSSYFCSVSGQNNPHSCCTALPSTCTSPPGSWSKKDTLCPAAVRYRGPSPKTVLHSCVG